MRFCSKKNGKKSFDILISFENNIPCTFDYGILPCKPDYGIIPCKFDEAKSIVLNFGVNFGFRISFKNDWFRLAHKRA